jgi:hypothetical protein
MQPSKLNDIEFQPDRGSNRNGALTSPRWDSAKRAGTLGMRRSAGIGHKVLRRSALIDATLCPNKVDLAVERNVSAYERGLAESDWPPDNRRLVRVMETIAHHAEH